jgi:hypothetical protein
MNPYSPARPLCFVDIDDVLVISKEFTSYQVLMTFKTGDVDGWPELWDGLVFQEGRDNLAQLNVEFAPQYVISSSWSKYLTRAQMEEVLRRTGLSFVADNLHPEWTTPKGTGSARVTEIENWIDKHRPTGTPVLILDDHESGWSLYESHLDKAGYVVLCDSWVGFVGEKLAQAQALLRAQITEQ